MHKQEFLATLRRRLAGLPQEDVEQSIEYYGEMLEDRMEEGLSEEEAVAALGSVDEIVKEILMDIPLKKLVGQRLKPKRALRTWEIIFLITGFPLWFPLIVAAFSVALVLYAVVWSLVLALYAIDVALAACGIAGVLSIVVFLFRGNIYTAILFLGGGLTAAGASIFFFFACNAVAKCTGKFMKKQLLWIKRCFVKKEA